MQQSNKKKDHIFTYNWQWVQLYRSVCDQTAFREDEPPLSRGAPLVACPYCQLYQLKLACHGPQHDRGRDLGHDLHFGLSPFVVAMITLQTSQNKCGTII